MPRQATGIIVLIAAAGMMAALLGKEIEDVQSWVYLTTPAFVGKALTHIGSLIGMYLAGQLIPTAERLKPKE